MTISPTLRRATLGFVLALGGIGLLINTSNAAPVETRDHRTGSKTTVVVRDHRGSSTVVRDHRSPPYRPPVVVVRPPVKKPPIIVVRDHRDHRDYRDHRRDDRHHDARDHRHDKYGHHDDRRREARDHRHY